MWLYACIQPQCLLAAVCRAGKPRMTTRERLFLTPVEKFLGYGIVPFKLILNAVLVVLVTSLVRIGCALIHSWGITGFLCSLCVVGPWDCDDRRDAAAPSLTPSFPLQILVMNTQQSNYIQAASRNYYYYFFPDDYDFSRYGHSPARCVFELIIHAAVVWRCQSTRFTPFVCVQPGVVHLHGQ